MTQKRFAQVLSLFAVAILVLLPARPGEAAIIFGTGNPNNTGTENVIFNNCPKGLVQEDALTVQGCLSDDRTTIVDFTSDEKLEAGGGQARIEALDGAFDTLDINLNDSLLSFNKIILALNIDGNKKGADTGRIVFTAFLVGGGSVVSVPFAVGGNSNAFFFIKADAGERLSRIRFVSDVGVNAVLDEVSQVRLGGVEGSANVLVPEPASLALVGLGLLGLAARLRRRT